MARGVGWRVGLASSAVVGLAVACSGSKDRNFASPSDAMGGGGGVPSATGGVLGRAGNEDETSDAGAPNGGAKPTDSGEAGGAGGCSSDACEPTVPDVDDCNPNPCKNDGVCHDVGDVSTCTCKNGFAGQVCGEKALEALPLLTGATSCSVNALNGNGRVAVGDCQVAGTRTSFWWKPSIGTKALPGSGDSRATALTNDGTYVVGYAQESGGVASGLSWFNGSGDTGYQGLMYDGMAVSCTPKAVSDDGTLVAGGSESSNGSPRAVRWVNHEPQLLGVGHGEIYVTAMSGDGNVIVGYAYDPDAAIKWTPETGLTSLPLPIGEDRGAAFGVSRDGRVVVGESGGKAVRWVAGAAPVSLGITGIARAANQKGDVIVGSSGGEAMVWDETQGARLLSDVLFDLGATLTGWTLSEAVAVSADGRIVAGNGSLAGVEQAWLARLP